MSLFDNIKSYSEKVNLSTTKRKDLHSFFKNGFPTTKDEEWKYTSLKKIVADDFSIEENKDIVSEIDFEKYSLGFENKIVFVNGTLISSPIINGILISDFTDFKTENKDVVCDINSSLATKGFSISVTQNTIFKNPIEILFLTNTKNDNFSQYRNQIIIGNNSKIKFVEKMRNLSKTKCFVNHFTQITLGKNSNCEYNKIQTNRKNSILIDNLNIFQDSDSTCNINTFIFGGCFIRNNLNFEQNGLNSESNMNGISVLDNNQFADNHTFIDHKVPNCRSNEMYKGIYMGNSKGVFNGKIMVRPDAQKIDAFQSNNNLLLSDNSTIDSKPQLEIYADDVKCSHGCTIGQLSEDAMFYMRSRGIAEKEAKAVLSYAFASEAIEKTTIPKVRLLAQKLLTQKLNVDLDFNI